MLIRNLKTEDAEMYRELRLESLKYMPEGYYETWEEESRYTVHDMEERLTERSKPNNFILGAFINDQLIGMMGFHQYKKGNLLHKAYIYGVYIKPNFNTEAVKSQLLEEVIRRAKKVKGLEQIISSEVSEEGCILYKEAGFEVFGIAKRAIKCGNKTSDEYHMVLYLNQRDSHDSF